MLFEKNSTGLQSLTVWKGLTTLGEEINLEINSFTVPLLINVTSPEIHIVLFILDTLGVTFYSL